MTIEGISAADPVLGQTTGGAPTPEALDKTAFMELLVAQLENQDPLEPTNNEEFVAQLATFSSLEQLENLNDGILTMVLLQQSNALMSHLSEGSALIGKTVGWTDPTSGVSGSGVVDSVKVLDGAAYLKINGVDVPLVDVTEVLSGGAPTSPDPTGTGTGDDDSGDGSTNTTDDGSQQ